MKIKTVTSPNVTKEQLDTYLQKITEGKAAKLHMLTALDVGMDLKIITIRIDGEITLVNPIITEVSNDMVMYHEYDFHKRKPRKTKRYTRILVTSDNLPPIEFKAASDNFNSKEGANLLEDVELYKCVTVQRLIDAINGIDIKHSSRAYNTQIIGSKRIGRNEKVLIKSESGDTKYVKYKHHQLYINNGYKII